MFDKNKGLNQLAKNLRNNMTSQERKLWYDCLKLLDYKFNRQFIIGNYIADFYCNSKKLVIELDGGQHFEDDALKYDENRTKHFNSLGIRVVRYTNLDIDKRFKDVCEDILLILNGEK
jgi:very-short-patch-repair endonuclease